jgi:hydrogenase nickel incorporation protein HypA/HybF
MHELSIAMALVEMATEKLETLGAVRVEALHLRLGPLSGVVRDALEFSFGLAAEGTPIQGARLVFQDVPLVVRCPTCGDQEIGTLQSFRCPLCDAPTGQVVQGRELELSALEVRDDAAANR